MKKLGASFVLIGLVALGCSDDSNTNDDGGEGGSGNTGNQGGSGGAGNMGGQGGTGNNAGDGGSGGVVNDVSVAFEETTYTSGETPDAVDVDVVLSADSALTDDLVISINVDAASTATVGDDVVDDGVLEVTFPSGAMDGAVQTISITPVADLEREVDEDLVLEFATNPDATVGSPTTLTLVDDDMMLVGHSRFISSGTIPVNMNVDIHDPETSLSRVNEEAIGYVSPSGAAFDSVTGTLYVVTDGAQDVLGTVDPATGAITTIGGTGFSAVQCLAFDTDTGTLYGIQQSTTPAEDTLLVIDTETGRGTPVGTNTGMTNLEACEFVTANSTLYAVNDGSSNSLVTVDTTTGVGTLVGAAGGLGTSEVEGLAYDADGDILYGANDSANNLFTINRTTGEETIVAAYSDPDVTIESLAYDSVSNTLYGFDRNKLTLVEIETSGAVITHSQVIGARFLDAIDYDTLNDVFYGINAAANTLVSWSTTTGALQSGIVLQAVSGEDFLGLAIDDAGVIYAYDDASQEIVTINPTTGALTFVGAAPAPLTSLAYDPTNDFLFGSTLDELWLMDPADATGASIGFYAIATDVQGLAYDDANDVLYAIEDFLGDHFVYSIDPNDATDTILGLSAARHAYGLGFDGTSLFTVDEDRGAVATIDDTTGALTLVGSFAVYPDGLASNATTDIVYATETDLGILWGYDVVTGNATQIGFLEDSSFNSYLVEGLAYDTGGDVLYGTQNNDGAGGGDLVTIDTTTGEVTIVGALNLGNADVLHGLAWDDTANILYGATPTGLFTINTGTGAATLVAAFPAAHDDMRGLGFDDATGRLIGVDGGLDAGDFAEAVLIDPTTAVTTTLRRLGRGANCSVASLSDCSLARGIDVLN